MMTVLSRTVLLKRRQALYVFAANGIDVAFLFSKFDAPTNSILHQFVRLIIGRNYGNNISHNQPGIMDKVYNSDGCQITTKIAERYHL